MNMELSFSNDILRDRCPFARYRPMDFTCSLVLRTNIADAFDRPCDVFLIALNVPSLPSIIPASTCQPFSAFSSGNFTSRPCRFSSNSATSCHCLIKTRSKWRLLSPYERSLIFQRQRLSINSMSVYLKDVQWWWWWQYNSLHNDLRKSLI